MGDDLTDMGISATASAADGARAGCSRRITRSHPLAGHGCHDRPEAEPRPSRCPSPSQGDASRSASMATSRASSEIEGFGPRRFAGGRSAVACCRDFNAGVERGTGAKTESRPHRPAGGRRPNPCRERWRHSRRDLRRPKGPDVSVLASSSSTCMINSPIRFMAMSSSAFTGSPLRSLSEASIPAIAFHGHCSSRKISTPNCRDKSSTGSPRKIAAGQPHACASSSTALIQVPSGLPAKPGPGKTWTSQARPRLPQAHQQQLCSQNCRSCSGPPWTLRLSQFCVQGNRVRLRTTSPASCCATTARMSEGERVYPVDGSSCVCLVRVTILRPSLRR